MKTVVITGAAGYIGGQTALSFKDAGYRVMGIDQGSVPKHLEAVFDDFISDDFADTDCMHLIAKADPVAIVHCAGTSLVGPSVTNPSTYYYNNFVKTKELLDYLIANKRTDIKFIFSSSAAVYGEPVMVPIHEEDPAQPISPYGESKLMVEMMLKSYATAYGLKFVAFRYFNVAGADSQGRHGPATGGTHIITRLLDSIKFGKEFVLYGTAYPTPDGSCIRDYIHVEDLAQAHLLAAESPVEGIYNLGTEKGVSNKEIIAAVDAVTGQHPIVSTGANRTGDPAVLTASPARWRAATGWQSKFNLADMLAHTWKWYNR